MRKILRFLRNGVQVEIDNFDPNETLLDYLRLKENSVGTKEGCCEGDCGACSVVIGRLKDDQLIYETVNSCILLLGQIDGKDLITIEDLSRDNTMHEVQEAMIETHGSQCGFCTPGIVMSLFAFFHSSQEGTRENTNDWLAGNLCRCTGYKPIADAAAKVITSKGEDFLSSRYSETKTKLQELADQTDIHIGDEARYFSSPASLESLTAAISRDGDAVIVSGNTDVGLWITKQLRDLPKIIYTGRVDGFDTISNDENELCIGAGASYADAFQALENLDPDLGELVRRIGSKQVRASGTIGGNIANGSPIGDMPPALIALGAKLELCLGEKKRVINLEDYFITYGKQDRVAGEIVSNVIIPKLANNEQFKAFKISKRFDQDITAVLGAFYFQLDGDRIEDCRFAFGGMAAIPKRATHVEHELRGAKIGDEAALARAINAFKDDFSPLSDMRASANYRLQVAQNLLRKVHFEISADRTDQTRLLANRVVAR